MGPVKTCEVTGETLTVRACWQRRHKHNPTCKSCTRIWVVNGVLTCGWCGQPWVKRGTRKWCGCEKAQNAKYEHYMVCNEGWRKRNPEKVKAGQEKQRAKRKHRPREKTKKVEGTKLHTCQKCGAETVNYYLCALCLSLVHIPTECMGYELPAGF